MTGLTRVRFAPSPTGELHVGNARTALFNWLFARHDGGCLIVRSEDTDQERTRRAFERHILEDLAWLGMDWDEGPDCGGAYGPYRQSERLPLYRDALRALEEKGCVYPCYCTEEALEAERLALLGRGQMPRYGGRCRSLTERERGRKEAEGCRPAVRFRVPPGSVAFTDLVRGEMSFPGEAVGDFILVRSNGVPAYNFAAVVDDHLMAVTHVIRGEDHLTNTALQLLLYNALGWTPPRFAHHALILGKDRAKLGKRHGAVAIRAYRDAGILPEALVNHLALVGNSFGEGIEFCRKDDMVRLFSLDRVARGGAIFDEEKLRWFHLQHLRQADPEALLRHLAPFLARAGYPAEQMEASWLLRAVRLVQPNLEDLSQIGAHLDPLVDGRFHVAAEARKVLEAAEAREAMRCFAEVMERRMPETPAGFRELLEEVRSVTGLRGKALYLPLRAAVTGRLHGPELPEILSFLGADRLRRRIAAALREEGKGH